jgi:hypothetical protein
LTEASSSLDLTPFGFLKASTASECIALRGRRWNRSSVERSVALRLGEEPKFPGTNGSAMMQEFASTLIGSSIAFVQFQLVQICA